MRFPDESVLGHVEVQDAGRFEIVMRREAAVSLTVSPVRLYDALWLLKASREGDDSDFPTLPEVRLILAALTETEPKP